MNNFLSRSGIALRVVDVIVSVAIILVTVRITKR